MKCKNTTCKWHKKGGSCLLFSDTQMPQCRHSAYAEPEAKKNKEEIKK